MATITIGRLTEFYLKSNIVTAYMERANLYFQAKDIVEAKQVAVSLGAIGPKAYVLLRSLLISVVPKYKTLLAQLVDILKKYYKPKPLVIAKRLNFTDGHSYLENH